MAKKRTVEPEADDEDGPLVITFRCDGDLRTAFENYRKAQRVPPTKTDVMTVALQDFLREEGFYPLKD